MILLAKALKYYRLAKLIFICVWVLMPQRAAKWTLIYNEIVFTSNANAYTQRLSINPRRIDTESMAHSDSILNIVVLVKE